MLLKLPTNETNKQSCLRATGTFKLIEICHRLVQLCYKAMV